MYGKSRALYEATKRGLDRGSANEGSSQRGEDAKGEGEVNIESSLIIHRVIVRVNVEFIFRQTLQKERQAREAAEKEKNELLERLNRLEEEAIKARDGKYMFFKSFLKPTECKLSEL